MQGWHLHDFWPRFCHGKSCHLVCFVVAACCLCDISCLLACDLWNGDQCPGSPVYTHAPTRAPLSCISRELLLNCSWTAREHVVNYSWIRCELFVNYPWQFVTVVALRKLSSTGTHPPNVFMNSLHIVNDPVAKFDHDQNFEHFKILDETWHAVTTGLRILHASLRLVCALARLESCRTGTTRVVPMCATESCKCQPCLSLLKTQWEKEKLLVMSNFSFSHIVFYLF